jgi:hypothetical protein
MPSKIVAMTVKETDDKDLGLVMQELLFEPEHPKI